MLCRKLYTPGIHLAVDEMIERFTGRAPKIVNIPTKPTPEGFKIWVLGNQGYILDCMFHAKGNKKGLYDLDEVYTKEEGFSKTQVVVLDLLLQRDDLTNSAVIGLVGYKFELCDQPIAHLKLRTGSTR